VLSIWQWLFVASLALGAFVVLGSLTGLSLDADADADADSDFDAEAEADTDVDAEAEADGEASTGVGTSAAPSLLSLLGFGRVPLSILLITALVSFGGAGLSLDYALTALVKAPTVRGPLVSALALVIAIITVGVVARAVGRVVRPVETYALPLAALVGCVGVAELDIDRRFGIAWVTDDTGSRMQIRCRSYAERITKGEPVLLTEYDPETRSFLVEKSPV